MQVFNFSVKKRLEMGRNVKDLAEQGMVSGVVYGPELEQNFYIKMREADMKKLYGEITERLFLPMVQPAYRPQGTTAKKRAYARGMVEPLT